MRIVIVGAGAIGGYIGAQLSRVGADVVLHARGAHLRAMEEHGLRVIAEDGEFTVKPPVSGDLAAIGPCDVVFLGVKAHGLTPLARIDALAVTAGDPVVMLAEPWPATRRALERAGRRSADIDLFEVNEAFAPVPMAWLDEIGADPARLNVNGGAIALGHPLGASGTKLMATLVHALKARGLRYGLQTMCEGGGIANATIVEAL